MERDRSVVMERARKTYGERYEQLHFLGEQEAAAAEAQRGALLSRIGERVRWGAGGTKLDCTRLSPGCRICMEGGWSCLFINGRCNTRCFYCPDRQDEEAVPVTNSLAFPAASEYIEYLDRFGFTGVSISGGEPLLTLDRTLSFLRAVKRRFGAAVHTWLYTNGILLTPQVAGRLRDAGLDEVRLDIGATRYRLDAVGVAAAAIPCVTVEVPAVPQDLPLLATLLAPMADQGVAHLNLHQLKATAHNLPSLHERGYTFLHGDQLTVLESELGALGLLEQALDSGVGLPINYCSYVYKERYQRAAARRRSGVVVKRGFEDMTRSGLLRRISVTGEADELASRAEGLRQAGARPEEWSMEDGGRRLCFAASLWEAVGPGAEPLHLAYTLPRIVPSVTYRHPFVELRLGRARRIAVERVPAAPQITLAPGEAGAFHATFLAPGSAVLPAPGGSAGLAQAMELEWAGSGLQEYF